MRTYAARRVREGSFPLWTSMVQCGFPLYADGQTGITYPFNLLYILSPTPEANDWFMAIHYLFLVIATYLLLERYMSPIAASVSANTFLYSTYVQSSHPVAGNSSTILWLPLGLYLIDSWRRGSPKALWWTAFANGLAILAWEPCTLKNVFAFQAVYLAYRVWLGSGGAQGESGFRDFKDFAGRFADKSLACAKAYLIIFGVAVLIAGIQVWPAIGFVSQSSRTNGYESALDFEEFRGSRIPPHLFLSFLHPDLFGTVWAPKIGMIWEEHMTIFCGFGAIFLVPCAWMFGRNKQEVVFWTIALIVGTLLITGSPLYSVTYYIPVFNWFRWPSRYAIYFAFSIAALAGFGVDGLLALISTRQRHIGILRPAVALGLGLLAIFGHVRSLKDYLGDRQIYSECSKSILELAHSEKGFRLMPLASALYDDRASEAIIRRNARFCPPDFNLHCGVPCATIMGQEHTVTQRIMRDVLRLKHPNALRVAAVTHVSSPKSLQALNRAEIDVYSPVYFPTENELDAVPNADCTLYRFRAALPRARMVYRARTVADSEERLRLIGSDAFDPATEAIVEKDVSLESSSGISKVDWEEIADCQLTINVSTDATGLLVVADTHSENIVARLDGEPTEMLRVNHGFRGVVIPPGNHVVTMEVSYRPLFIGAAVSAIGLLICFGALCKSNTAQPEPATALLGDPNGSRMS
ncbi:MAG: hypothetical protein U1D30_08925 [Planctomycetota bacterium]